MSATHPYVPVAKANTVTGLPVTEKLAKETAKTRKLIAALRKKKLAIEALDTAQRRYSAAFRLAAEITRETPYGESLKRKAEELAAEKGVRAAMLGIRRAERSVLAAGGTNE